MHAVLATLLRTARKPCCRCSLGRVGLPNLPAAAHGCWGRRSRPLWPMLRKKRLSQLPGAAHSYWGRRSRPLWSVMYQKGLCQQLGSVGPDSCPGASTGFPLLQFPPRHPGHYRRTTSAPLGSGHTCSNWLLPWPTQQPAIVPLHPRVRSLVMSLQARYIMPSSFWSTGFHQSPMAASCIKTALKSLRLARRSCSPNGEGVGVCPLATSLKFFTLKGCGCD